MEILKKILGILTQSKKNQILKDTENDPDLIKKVADADAAIKKFKKLDEERMQHLRDKYKGTEYEEHFK